MCIFVISIYMSKKRKNEIEIIIDKVPMHGIVQKKVR